MSTSAATLSRTRTVVLWGLLIVWFSEMTITSVRPLAEWWTQAWKMAVPDDPQLAIALYVTHALEGAAKGALGVLAVFALRSGSPLVRTALFVPMALVPPLNLAFPIREQGFLPQPTTIASVLSVILWGSFFLIREHGEQPHTPTDARPKRTAALGDLWFAANAIMLTLAAGLCFFAPGVVLKLTLPCLSVVIDGFGGETRPLTLTALAVGSHLAAVATATWIGAIYGRRDSTVRTAVAVANTLNAGLLCFVPLTRVALDSGRDCALSSMLVYAIPLFAGWLIYDTLRYRPTLTRRLRLADAGHH